MILVFKDFLEAVKREDTRRDLFITPRTSLRKYEMQRMMDEAHAAELSPTMNSTRNVITFGPSFALFVVAHPFMADQMTGMEFHAIQGLYCLDAYEGGDELKERLKAMIR